MVLLIVVAGLDPWAFSPRTRSVGIHESSHGRWEEGVDARAKPGHDGAFGAGEW
jgi:hypothetical protein